MKTESTKNYEMFKFREDNRTNIDNNHVKRLVQSIQAKDLLEMRPIVVNSDMEVIDGQHRLLAAKELQKAIYYRVERDLAGSDIILMNIAKSWGMPDFLNYYVKNGNANYIQLQDFMAKNRISFKIAIALTMAPTRENQDKFKKGEYKFVEDLGTEDLDNCWRTIDYIKKMNGFSDYTSTSRFWKCLLKLVQHEAFNAEKWYVNLQKMIERVGPRARSTDYMTMFTDIHNWRNPSKVDLVE